MLPKFVDRHCAPFLPSLWVAIASEQGLKTAIFTGGDVGGTCVNRGCVPSKVGEEAVCVLAQGEGLLTVRGRDVCKWAVGSRR